MRGALLSTIPPTRVGAKSKAAECHRHAIKSVRIAIKPATSNRAVVVKTPKIDSEIGNMQIKSRPLLAQKMGIWNLRS